MQGPEKNGQQEDSQKKSRVPESPNWYEYGSLSIPHGSVRSLLSPAKVSLRQRQESLKHLSERRNRAQQALLPREQGNLDDPGESGDVKGF